MDRKVKERLVGAAVLVALGVWLIPWILDGPPPGEDVLDPTTALELPVPAVGGAEPLRRETIELEAARRSEPVAAEPTPAGEGDAVGTPAVPEPAPLAQADPAPPASTPVTAAASRAPRAAPPATTASAAPESGWMVQLGSFGDEANARRQAERVKSFGHNARIFPFAAGGRTMYRVRVGTFPTRNQAEATASSLSAHGFPAQIVAPE
jgi:DedD protein